MVHAPHFNNGKSLCGAEYSLEYVGEKTTCPACVELQMEYAKEMAEFETFSADYYKQVGDLITAALCGNNAAVYERRAEECRQQLQQAA